MNKRSWFQGLLIGTWLLVTLASLAAMYHLWWNRERVLYAGRSADEQRKTVVERAGIPAPTLELAKRADAAWPLDADYKADGSEVSLSYFKYLVLPRIPSGSEVYGIKERGGAYPLTPVDDTATSHRRFQTIEPTPRGLFMSALVLFAIAAGLSRFGFSVPEGMAGALLALCAMTVLLKPGFRSYAPVGVAMCVLGLAGAWVAWSRKNREGGLADRPSSIPLGKWERPLQWIAAAIVVGSIFWAFLMAVVVVPDDWDAWAQWAPKAKILLLSRGPLSEVKYFVPGSGDYPLLWPSVWAFSGWCAGGWEEQWSKGWGALFFALAAWQIKILSDRSGNCRSAGWLFAALLASMPVVPLVASWGYAEAPFWLMLVCAMTRLLAWRSSGARRELWRAGLFIAGAACTKNEGLLFAALGIAWVGLCGRRLRDIMAVGLPVLLCAGAWKAYVILGMDASNHVANSLVAAQPGVAQWAERLATAGEYIGRQWTDVKQWNLVLPTSILVATWILLRGKGTDRLNLLLPLGMLSGLLAVVMLHGENWLWQLGVAWNRLTIQFFILLLPVLVAGFGRRVPKSPDADCS